MGIGVWQVVLILVIVLIIFGAGKLPKVMGDVAKGIKNFKSGLGEGESGDDSKSLKNETESAPETVAETVAETGVKEDQPSKN